MKKTIVMILALTLLLSACAKPAPLNTTGEEEKTTKAAEEKKEEPAKEEVSSEEASADGNSVYSYVYESDPETLNYLTSSKNPDLVHTANFVSGLYSWDTYGKLVPELAESYEVSEDGMTYTFHLRDTDWVTATGEVYAPVTAQDWVTAIEYVVEQESSTLWLVEDIIKNLKEYVAGDLDIEEVGIKAIDEKTLEYTLNVPAPYFLSMTPYSIMFPVNADFLNSVGEDFGLTQADGILYNGPFILSELTAKSKIAYIKNENYWDKGNVHFDTVNYIFDDGKDSKSTINGFENGTYVSAGLRPTWEDFDKYVEKYKDNAYESLPNSTTFGFSINYNRRATEVTNKDAAALEATHKAVMNRNFRKALQASFGRLDYLKQFMPEKVALSSMRNMWTYPELVTNSKGQIYGEIVNAEFNKLEGTDRNILDGVNAYESKEDALKYIEAAKAEGVQFPITLDFIAIDIESYMKRMNSLKQSVEANSDGNILVDLHVMTREDASKILFGSNDPAEKDYDVNWFIGWGPDYADPKNFLDVYHPEYGAQLSAIGLNPLGEDAENDKIIEELGLVKYKEMLDKADSEYTDLDKRYQLYAQAEAYLLNEGLVIPNSQQTRGVLVSKLVPLTHVRGIVDVSLKYLQLQDEIVTVEQYEKAKAEWEAAKAKK